MSDRCAKCGHARLHHRPASPCGYQNLGGRKCGCAAFVATPDPGLPVPPELRDRVIEVLGAMVALAQEGSEFTSPSNPDLFALLRTSESVLAELKALRGDK